MKEFEYLVQEEKNPLEEHAITELGKKGWELAGVVSKIQSYRTDVWGNSGKNMSEVPDHVRMGTFTVYFYYFKRLAEPTTNTKP